MEININPFEFLLVMVGIIVGLAVARILAGVAAMVLRRESIRFYWLHLLWVLILFLLQVHYWFNLFSWKTLGNSFLWYLSSLTFPLSLYFASALFVPDLHHSERVDFLDHYNRNRKWFFSIATVGLIALIIHDRCFLEIGLDERINWIRAAATAAVFSLIWIPTRKVQEGIGLLLVGLLLVFLKFFTPDLPGTL